jgi:hypothetical protein
MALSTPSLHSTSIISAPKELYLKATLKYLERHSSGLQLEPYVKGYCEAYGYVFDPAMINSRYYFIPIAQ